MSPCLTSLSLTLSSLLPRMFLKGLLKPFGSLLPLGPSGPAGSEDTRA